MANLLASRVLELARLAFFTVSQSGTIDAWNRAAEELYGYPAAEVGGRTVAFLCFPGQRTVLTSSPEALSGGEVVERHRRRDGSEMFAHLQFDVLEGGLLICVRDVSAERMALSRLSASREALDAGRGELRRVAGRLLNAQETERRSIARELHDDFKQRLGALGFKLAGLAERFRQGVENSGSSLAGSSLSRDLDALGVLVEELGADIRSISHRLHPAALERLGLAAALQALAVEVEAGSGMAVRVSVRGGKGELPRDTALALYRVAQEALDNATRYSAARQVHVSLHSDRGEVRLAVADDGVGFDPAEAFARGGLGLLGMKERAHLLGGRLRLASEPGSGAEIEVIVPFEEEVAENALDEGVSSSRSAGEGQDGHGLRLLGPYKLLRVLDEDTTATVYLAEEPPPLRRQVAIKLHRAPSAGRRETLSFKAERQALAKLRHLNIGQIYEARTTEEGDPYIVMEYVPGMSITSYCDQYRLDLRQRIELFLGVCEGVAHIHQKGVLHRDLRPANVLVMEEAGRPIPKIVDFGIAKGLDQPLAEGTVWTQAAGTPAYVSPEVINGGEADTRTDVYALGVMLYELLTGVLPAESEAKVMAQLAGVGHPSPSGRLEGLGETELEAVAGARRIAPRALVRSLRGGLDWIVGKTLAPKPEMRYTGAAALAVDLRRYLRAEPVLVGPRTVSYRLVCLVRRRPMEVAAILLVLLALVYLVVW